MQDLRDYIIVAKDIKDGHWFILSDEIDARDCPFKTKKIHKKHEAILDAYLGDDSIKIHKRFTNGNAKGKIAVYNVHFLDTYDEYADYVIDENPNNEFEYVPHSPENFGFEHKEGVDILSEVYGGFVGTITDDDFGKLGCLWNEIGVELYQANKDYNLTLKKKKWWECEENFPCVVISDDNNEICFDICDNISCWKKFDDSVFNWRPATKQEILSLIVEGVGDGN